VQKKITILIPAKEEGVSISSGLEKICTSSSREKEVLVIVDDPTDSTIAPVIALQEKYPELRVVVSEFPPGPSNAIRFGFTQAEGDVVVVTMSDGCDDPLQIDSLVHLVERGVAVAAASRYMPGGQQVGGPRLKRILSRVAGRSFALITGVGTRDATNSFKAYSKAFVQSVQIHSRHGFEIGLEMTAKAKRLGLPVAEISTTWIDRNFGVSKFQLRKWVPKYLTWYLFGIGFEFVHKQAAGQLRLLREASR